MGKVQRRTSGRIIEKFLYIAAFSVIIISLITCTSGTGEGETIPAPTIFVDASASPGGDGSSWETAYIYLQDGLARAKSGDIIGIAQGVYYPDEDEGGNVVMDNDSMSFHIPDGVKLYGGFSSGGGSYDPDIHMTVLSGDIDQNDTTDTEGRTLKVSDLSGDNSNHVVYVQNVTSSTLLSGVTVSGGDNDNAFSNGGGMMCLSTDNKECSTVVQDVVFTGNRAGDGGAVVFNMAVTGGTYNARFEDVTFQYNAATGDGGAMSISGSDTGYNGTNNIILSNVTFSQNTAGNDGGGLFDDARAGTSNLKIKNAGFFGNTATRYGGGIRSYFHLGGKNNQYIANSVFNGNSANSGGGMYSEHGVSSSNTDNLILVNVVFSGNQSSLNGGALYYSNNQVVSGNPSFVNVTFASNVAADAGGADQGGALFTILSIQTELHNCILWGNTATNGAQVFNVSTPPVFYYSVVQGSIPGTDGGSNSTNDPLFLQTPSAGDGDWTTLSDNNYGDLRLQTTPTASPGIDAGSNGALPADSADLDEDGNTSEPIPFDLDNETRIANTTVDMGAYEN